MSIRLGDEAPDFTAETTEGTIGFHQWKDGKWAVLFSHPADFTRSARPNWAGPRASRTSSTSGACG